MLNNPKVSYFQPPNESCQNSILKYLSSSDIKFIHQAISEAGNVKAVVLNFGRINYVCPRYVTNLFKSTLRQYTIYQNMNRQTQFLLSNIVRQTVWT